MQMVGHDNAGIQLNPQESARQSPPLLQHHRPKLGEVCLPGLYHGQNAGDAWAGSDEKRKSRPIYADRYEISSRT